MRCSIEENIQEVEKKIQMAVERSGRKRDEVLLLAVSKTQSIESIEIVVGVGLISLGENKVQEVMDKYDTFHNRVHWHMIGHLQSNKVKYIVDKVDLIHAVDGLKLAQEIEKRAASKGSIVNILIEVNMAKEESKFGILPKDAQSLIEEISQMEHIKIKGLMTVAPIVKSPEENRLIFREMKELLIDIGNKKINNVDMQELSMGMTGDYEVAIEEGATIIRVGTGIFGKRQYEIEK